ncbi:MAG: ABC-F family ATP-binding cassette domain-containing protein [Caldilineaceae bacterium]
MLLTISHITKSYGDQAVLSDVSFVLNPGRHVGLVGANGAGKSTLLKIVAGEVKADAGEVAWMGGITTGYLPQALTFWGDHTLAQLLDSAAGNLSELAATMRRLEARMAAADSNLDQVVAEYGRVVERFERQGGYDLDYRIDMVLDGLGLTGVDRTRVVSTLSGGEKVRANLAALLLTGPDVLLLDEPTNHLDPNTLAWLEEYLAGYAGGLLIVSHDRHFLNRTVHEILEIDEHSHQARLYTGDYDAYAAAKVQERVRWEAEYAAQQEEIADLRAAIKGKSRQVAHNRPARDSDKFLKHFKRERIDTAVARNVQSAEERLRRIEADPIPRPPERLKINPEFDPLELAGRFPLSTQGLCKVYGDRLLFRDVTFSLAPRSRVVITGANGTGKSTLLKIVAGLQTADQGEVIRAASVRLGYLDQEQERLVQTGTLIDAYREDLSGHWEEHKAELMGYGLFAWPELLKPVVSLSIGQKRKLQIAQLIAQRANLLLLDEPTNHISFDVLEEFEQALLEFPGPILAISHDRRFIQRFAQEVWELRESTLFKA